MAAFKKGVGINLVTSLLNKQKQSESCFSQKNVVIDRARTGDNQNHNLGLYQLSYDHRWNKNIRALLLTRQVYGKGFPVHKLT